MEAAKTTNGKSAAQAKKSNVNADKDRRAVADTTDRPAGAVGRSYPSGARPKTAYRGNAYGSYEAGSSRNEGRSDDNAEQVDDDSEYPEVLYSKVVTRSGWKTPTYEKKRKRENSGPFGAKPVRPIKGFSNRTTRELSVQGLSNDGFGTLEEIEESISAYFQERKVELVFVRVFHRKHEFKTVGCKIAVNEADADAVMDHDFWPDDVFARKWHPGNRNRKDDDDQSSAHT